MERKSRLKNNMTNICHIILMTIKNIGATIDFELVSHTSEGKGVKSDVVGISRTLNAFPFVIIWE